jgi:hypothetical protein
MALSKFTYGALCPNEKKFIPDRVSGDIPFHLYRSLYTSSPAKYIEFLKKLELSASRHDFLFWVFDIYCATANGVEETAPFINAQVLDSYFEQRFPYYQKILRCTCRNIHRFSDYLYQTYPMIFNDERAPLACYPNNKELYEYRKEARQRLRTKDFIYINHDEYFFINPMQGLTSTDFRDPPMELNFDPYDKRRADKQSFFAFYNYFIGLLTYVGEIPNTANCILVNRDPYKRLQAETVMNKLDLGKFAKIDRSKAKELYQEDAVVVVAVEKNEEELIQHGEPLDEMIYKRGKLLGEINSSNEKEVWVLFVDYGECKAVPIQNIYAYDFGIYVPKLLTTIVPRTKLRSTLQFEDLYVFDFFEKRYAYVGRKTGKFNPAPNMRVECDAKSVTFDPDDEVAWSDFEDDDEDSKIIDNLEKDAVYGVENPWVFENDDLSLINEREDDDEGSGGE